MALRGSCLRFRFSHSARLFRSAPTGKSLPQAVKEDVNDRRGVESERLAQDESANHGNTQRAANLRADAGAKSQRKAAKQRGHGGHHDRAEAEQAGFIDRVGRILAVLALSLKSEIDHHDSV